MVMRKGSKYMKNDNKNNNDMSRCNIHCESEVLECNTIIKCHSKQYNKAEENMIIAKVPIVLSQVELEINIEHELELEIKTNYISSESKHTIIKECNIVPNSNNLFVEGYVEKYIEYSEIESIESLSSGKLKHMTIRLPFKVVTQVPFEIEPRYGKVTKKSVEVLKSIGLNKEVKEQSWVYYNKPEEKVYCELDWVKILETNIIDILGSKDEVVKKNKLGEKIIMKMALHIGLKVLQNQSVFFSNLGECIALNKENISSNKGHSPELEHKE